MRISEESAGRMAARLAYLEKRGAALVIDGDVHPTPFADLPEDVAERVRKDAGYYHGRPLLAEDLLATLDLAGVDMALCWQNPAVLRYGEDRDENFRKLSKANRSIAELAKQHPERVIPAGWTDPRALGVENAKVLVRECVESLGMPIVKMNPAQNEFPIDDDDVAEVYDTIVETGAIPTFHFGSDTPYTPPEGLENMAGRHPDHPVIGVHMGGGGGHFIEAENVYQSARALGLRRSNIFFVLSAIRDPHIESALIAYARAGEPFVRNLAAGSDAPYGNMIWNFGGFRALFAAMRSGRYLDPRLAATPGPIDDETVAAFMGGNLARLVADADRRILRLAGHGAATR